MNLLRLKVVRQCIVAVVNVIFIPPAFPENTDLAAERKLVYIRNTRLSRTNAVLSDNQFNSPFEGRNQIALSRIRLFSHETSVLPLNHGYDINLL